MGAASAQAVGHQDDPVALLHHAHQVGGGAHRGHFQPAAADAVAGGEQVGRHRADRDRNLGHPDVGQPRRLPFDQCFARHGDERAQAAVGQDFAGADQRNQSHRRAR